MFKIGDKDLESLIYVDEDGVKHEVEALYLGKELVWPEKPIIRIIGSFKNSIYTFFYLNDTKINLSQNFDYTTDQKWDKTYVNYSYGVFGQYLQSIDYTEGIKDLTTLSSFFNMQRDLIRAELSGIDTTNVTNMYMVFMACQSLEILDLSSWNTENVETTDRMFSGCSSLTNLNVANWNLKKLRNANSMFYNCPQLVDLDISNWRIESLVTSTSMFEKCAVEKLDLSNWNMHNLQTAYHMCINSSLQEFIAPNWNLEKCDTIEGFFYNCKSLLYVDIKNWNVENVTNISAIFNGCTAITDIDLSGWNVSNAVYLASIFSGCSKLVTVNLANWNFSEEDLKNYGAIFGNCSALKNIIGPITNISFNISLSSSSLLTIDSAMVIINGLKNGVTDKTVTFHKNVYDALTDKQKAVATAKGWSVVSA